jgi:WD40 repeat protein
VRQWEYDTGVCIAIFKFADPISVAKVSARYNMLFTASWDKMVRCVDLEQNKVMKSFIASKEAIKCMEVYQNWIFVAGCDPIIRSFDLTGGDPHRPEIPN